MDKFLSGFDIPPSASQSILDDWESGGEKTASDNEDIKNENVTDQISGSTPEMSPVIKRKSIFNASSPILTSTRRRPATSPIISRRKKVCSEEATTPKSASLSRKRKLVLDEVDVNSTPPAAVGPISSAWSSRSIVKGGQVVSEKKKPGASGVKKFIENLLASSQELFPDRAEDDPEDVEDVTDKIINVDVPDSISGINWLSSVGENLNSSDNIEITLCNSQEGRRPAAPAITNESFQHSINLVENEALTDTVGNDEDVSANKNILGSKWLSDIRSQSTSGSHTSGSPGPSQDAIAELTCSAKKKKPLKKGLLSKLERTLKGVESGRALKQHLLRNFAPENGDGDLELSVLSSRSVNAVQVVRCQTADSRKLVLLINEEFGLVEGEAISISPPWCSFSLPSSHTQVLVGVTKWQTISPAMPPQSLMPPPPPVTVNMICKCQTRERRGPPCDADDESHGLLSLLALPCPREGSTTPNMVNVVQSKAVHMTNMSGSPKCVLDMVENMGGCSSSPRTNPRCPSRLDLVIHRVLTRVKQNLNETLNATLACWPSSGAVDVSLLCEDPAGDFTLVKLDGELRNNPLWSSLFSEGDRWEGSRVKMVGLYPQDRLTANRHGRLFGVIKAVKQTQQRFLYVLRAYVDSRIEKLKNKVCEPTFWRLREAVGRCNVMATLLYRTPETIYITDDSVQSSSVNYVKVSYSSSCLFPEELGQPEQHLTVSILGLSVDTVNGTHSLDCYSSVRLAPSLEMTSICPPVWSGMAQEGDLVTVGGRVAAVDEDKSVEWLSCANCGREDLEEITDEDDDSVVYNCRGCQKNVKPVERLTLVCRIIAEAGLVWVQLKDKLAKKLLASVGEGEDIIAEDVIGSEVEKMVCIFQRGMLCQAQG